MCSVFKWVSKRFQTHTASNKCQMIRLSPKVSELRSGVTIAALFSTKTKSSSGTHTEKFALLWWVRIFIYSLIYFIKLDHISLPDLATLYRILTLEYTYSSHEVYTWLICLRVASLLSDNYQTFYIERAFQRQYCISTAMLYWFCKCFHPKCQHKVIFLLL